MYAPSNRAWKYMKNCKKKQKIHDYTLIFPRISILDRKSRKLVKTQKI